MTAFIIVLVILTYLSTGLYVSGRFGFTFDTDYNEDYIAVGAFFCPILWPAFIVCLVFYRFWQWGSRRRF